MHSYKMIALIVGKGVGGVLRCECTPFICIQLWSDYSTH